MCRYSIQLYQYRVIGDVIQEEPHFVLYAESRDQLTCEEVTSLIADILFYEDADPFERMGDILKRRNVSPQVFITTWFEQLAVDPRFRMNGVGSRLLDEVERISREMKIQS